MSGILNLVINKDNFDVLSADTSFYSYMDQSRLYYTFDALIADEDREMFVRRAQAPDYGKFYMRMLALDGSIVHFFVMMTAGSCPTQVQLTLIDMEQILAKQEELEALLMKHIAAEKSDDVGEFISAVKSGKRHFEIYVDGNFLNENQEAKYTIIRGGTVYRDGEPTGVTGYIRKVKEHAIGSARKIEYDPLTGVLSKSEITNLAIHSIDVEKQPDGCGDYETKNEGLSADSPSYYITS